MNVLFTQQTHRTDKSLTRNKQNPHIHELPVSQHRLCMSGDTGWLITHCGDGHTGERNRGGEAVALVCLFRPRVSLPPSLLVSTDPRPAPLWRAGFTRGYQRSKATCIDKSGSVYKFTVHMGNHAVSNHSHVRKSNLLMCNLNVNISPVNLIPLSFIQTTVVPSWKRQSEWDVDNPAHLITLSHLRLRSINTFEMLTVWV